MNLPDFVLFITLFLALAEQNTAENEIEATEQLPWSIFSPEEHHYTSLKTKRNYRGRRAPSHHQATYIEDCVQVIGNPGTYVVRPTFPGDRACGVYIAGLHDEIITVDISFFDVSCSNGGIVAFFDGWEMNGHIFPSEYDHSHTIDSRVVQLCSETFPLRRRLRLSSSQNVALLQYKIQELGEGFVFKVSMDYNKDPCNVLMTEDRRLLTLTNSGKRRNCSLTAVLSPPNFKMVQFHIGPQTRYTNLESPCFGSDFVEIGGASNLDPSQMEEKESICGRQPTPAKKGLTILCDSSSIRLVSSGRFNNSLAVVVKEASDEDMNYQDNIVMMCPGYM